MFALMASASGMSACMVAPSDGHTPPEESAAEPPVPPTSLGLMPLPGRFLDRSNRNHNGLLAVAAAKGAPARFGADVDPLILEARRFYDTLGTPNGEEFDVDYADPFTGDDPGLRETAPTTFAKWKQTFGFPLTGAGENLEAYRERIGAIIYYNKHELGLGRELGCREFVDGVDAAGKPMLGVACFVTNYGFTFRDRHNSLREAIRGEHSKNTVCITYRPAMEENYQVQFYVYGPTGARQEWAQLDTMGPRPVPYVCMNCHGGTYDEEKHLAKNARFLPTDPNMLDFAEGPGVPFNLTRSGQEERIRRINELALKTPLSSVQTELFEKIYNGRISHPGAVTNRVVAPAGWSESKSDEQFYQNVLSPYCGTCHNATDLDASNKEHWFYPAFVSKQAFRNAPMPSVVCGSMSMPNAQATHHAFWSPSREPIAVGDKLYATPAEAFLAFFGTTPETCSGDLKASANCAIAPDPDALCGDQSSGAACDLSTGRCVPSLGEEAPVSPMEPTGYCRLDGSRTCPSRQECRPALRGILGYDGQCFTCGLSDFPACEMGPDACSEGTIEINGMCFVSN